MTASLKAKLIAGFILAFLAGGAAGGYFAFQKAPRWRADYGHHPHLLTERLRDRVIGRLDLAPEQRARIEPILDRASKQLQEIRVETGGRVRQIMAETNRALQPELTEAQRDRLREIQESERERKGPRKGSRRHGPRPEEREAKRPSDEPRFPPRP